jgi:hypothetical protein
VEAPETDALLRFAASGGSIRLAWRGPKRDGVAYWVEYRVGSGLLSTRGAFPIEDTTVSFGPFPIAFWNDLAGYSPFRFRIVDPREKTRSPWQEFVLERTGGSP